MATQVPLDATQRAEFERRRSEWPSWWRSRIRRVLFAVACGAALLAFASVSFVQSDTGLTVFAFIVAALVDLGLLVKACIDPEKALELSVRLNVPSDEALRRGVWKYQIDGGRVPPPGEQPTPRYWDRWK